MNMKCNVYRVKVTISQIGGWNPGKENPEYTKEVNVLAISEESAEKKVEYVLKWDIRELLENSGGYVLQKHCELLIEDVMY